MDGLFWTSRRHWWEQVNNTVIEFHLSITSGSRRVQTRIARWVDRDTNDCAISRPASKGFKKILFYCDEPIHRLTIKKRSSKNFDYVITLLLNLLDLQCTYKIGTYTCIQFFMFPCHSPGSQTKCNTQKILRFITVHYITLCHWWHAYVQLCHILK